MITFNDKKLYVKGTCNVTLFDIDTGAICLQSTKATTGSITPKTSLNLIRAGLGNPIAAMIASDSGVTVDFELADFSMWAKSAQVGGQYGYGAPVPKCQVITAQSSQLVIDSSLYGVPIAKLGSDKPMCYIQTIGEKSLVMDDGVAYEVESDGTISGFYAEEGKEYKVWYDVQNVSAEKTVIKSLIDPKVVRFESQIAVFSNESGGANNRGTRVGWLYITIPYLKLQADGAISGDQTSPDATKISGEALAYDPSIVSDSCEDCESNALAYFVYAPDDEASAIMGIVVVGGSLRVDTLGYAQIPIRFVVGDGSLVAPTNTETGFTYESSDESVVTVSPKGLVYGESLGEAEIEITYTDENGDSYDCVINVLSIYGDTSDKVGYGKVGYMVIKEDGDENDDDSSDAIGA